MSLGKNIRTLRLQRGLNQKAFGSELGKSEKTIQRIEKNGDRLVYEDIIRLAKFFGMTAIELITYPEKLVPEEKIKTAYKNNAELERVEENYTNCKACADKAERIIDLKQNLNDLRIQLEFYQNQERPARSG